MNGLRASPLASTIEHTRIGTPTIRPNPSNTRRLEHRLFGRTLRTHEGGNSDYSAEPFGDTKMGTPIIRLNPLNTRRWEHRQSAGCYEKRKEKFINMAVSSLTKAEKYAD